MSSLLKITTIIVLVNGVDLQVFYANPFCMSQDVNDGACQVIENFFGFMPFQQAVNFLASSLTAFTTIAQIQELVDYITQSFGPNPLNTTDYESMSKSFNLIIFQPSGNPMPRNISSTEVLNSCDALELQTDSVRLVFTGYGDNCYGRNPSETLLEWTFDEMQQFSKVSNSTVIAVEWGFKGLSCYGYIQITLCLISKIADFFAHWLNQCVNIEKLEMIGHSMGAQLVGYISQNLASRGRLTNKIVGLDPAGPGFETGLRCQGIESGYSNYSMVFHSNPCQLGTCNFAFGDTNVLLNAQRGYCQPNCTCFLNPGCSHTYVTMLFRELALNGPMLATFTPYNPLTPGWGEPRLLTVYENVPPGYYTMNTYN